MRVEFRLPSLGADMESATLTEWLKKPGEPVRRGEPIATVETTKGLIDIEAYDDGTLEELVATPGTSLPVGALMARLEVEGRGAAPTPAPTSTAAPAPTPKRAPTSAPTPSPTATATAPAAGPRLRLSPAARRRAQELGVGHEALERAATAGTILHAEDIEHLAQATPAAPVAPSDARAAMRQAIGAAMTRAKRDIPHYYLAHMVDFGPARAWLTQHNASLAVGERLIDSVLVLKAVALAAARIEGFNGHFRDGRFEPSSAVHLGAAIAVRGGGLVAPALLDAESKDLATLMREFSALVTRVRAGHLRSGEFTAATVTVTSLGADGVDALYPIINPPQVAIVGAGAIRDAPWALEGRVEVRPTLALTLAADHRVTDGRAGARFLRTVAERLADPQAL